MRNLFFFSLFFSLTLFYKGNLYTYSFKKNILPNGPWLLLSNWLYVSS